MSKHDPTSMRAIADMTDDPKASDALLDAATRIEELTQSLIGLLPEGLELGCTYCRGSPFRCASLPCPVRHARAVLSGDPVVHVS